MGTVAIFILFLEHLCSLIWWEFPCISCLHVVGSEPNGHIIWISEYPIILTALKVDLWSTAFPFPLNIFSFISTINSQLQNAACFLWCSSSLLNSALVVHFHSSPHSNHVTPLWVQRGAVNLQVTESPPASSNYPTFPVVSFIPFKTFKQNKTKKKKTPIFLT